MSKKCLNLQTIQASTQENNLKHKEKNFPAEKRETVTIGILAEVQLLPGRKFSKLFHLFPRHNSWTRALDLFTNFSILGCPPLLCIIEESLFLLRSSNSQLTIIVFFSLQLQMLQSPLQESNPFHKEQIYSQNHRCSSICGVILRLFGMF